MSKIFSNDFYLPYLFVRNGAKWTPTGTPYCHGSCYIELGPGEFSSTDGFKYATCSGNQNKKKEIGFWCGENSDTGSVVMIAKECFNQQGDDVDSGLAVTETNAIFKNNDGQGYDFSNDAYQGSSQSTKAYSINLWVK